MPRRKQELFKADRPYHVMSKAVEGREVFSKKEDCDRFLFLLYAANVGSPAANLHRLNMGNAARALFEGGIPEHFVKPEHSPLVEIFSFVLAKDHYHLGLVSTARESIPRYMQKLNLAFAKYYNIKYQRQGPLFEGRFKIAPVRNPLQLDAIVRYINVKNVLDIYQNDWRKKGLDDADDAIQFLREYQYSSFPDLFLQRNCFLLSPSSRTELKKFLKDDLKNEDAYLKIFQYYIQNRETPFDGIFLE